MSVGSDNSPEMATSQPQPQPNDVNISASSCRNIPGHIKIPLDHCYALPASPTAVKTRLMEALARVESLERERKNAINREKRAKMSLKSVLGDLREKNLINEELSEKLSFYSDLKMDFFPKEGNDYTKDCREFALTLHLHGPKAYKYLRDTCHFPLPHPKTLQRQEIDPSYEICFSQTFKNIPGINKMMLDMLERKCQQDPATYGCVSLVLDAMSIKKHVQYNPHTDSMYGYVDMGDGKTDETDVASEALVFMVVGLQGHWKAPIAYFFTKSVSPEPQGVLLSQALEELHARWYV
ncbi:hypothetical protein ACEWY4_005918 [Coilia grayii]|uniref:Uncharacterized protein n=1 Tax=Coilia grayii TaxID=363190 RepID=A0ABD1KKP7_9TELE